MQSQLKIKELEGVRLVSELLCVCDECKTPFITECVNYSQRSQIECEQCGAGSVTVVRAKVCSANLYK